MTPKNILIRDEKNSDYHAISEVTIAAFEKMEISNHTEQFIIEALRSANALSISLVAEVDERIVGHIAFSFVTMSDRTKDWSCFELPRANWPQSNPAGGLLQVTI